MSTPAADESVRQLIIAALNIFGEYIKNSIAEGIINGVSLVEKDRQSPKDKPVVNRSVKYACEFFQVTAPTLRKYTREGLVKSTNFGRRVLYRDDELVKALPTIDAMVGKINKGNPIIQPQRSVNNKIKGLQAA